MRVLINKCDTGFVLDWLDWLANRITVVDGIILL
jgi:hypothetical protein